ncbi:MAG: carboxypeptidase-like regulatory domain-containing protein, partial [Halobacteriaceae archaeon]
MTKTEASEHATLKGTVTSASGDPVRNATVMVIQGSDVMIRNKTGEAGKFKFALSPGTYTIRVTGPDSGTRTRQITLENGTIRTIRFTLSRPRSATRSPTERVAVTVLWRADPSIDTYYVNISSPVEVREAQSGLKFTVRDDDFDFEPPVRDSEGIVGVTDYFLMRSNVSAGTYDVHVAIYTNASMRTPVARATKENSLTVVSGTGASGHAILKGKVTNAVGDPVKNASVVVSQGHDVITLTSTGKGGRFNFTLSPGTYRVRVSSSYLGSGRTTQYRQVTLKNETTRSIVITLPRPRPDIRNPSPGIELPSILATAPPANKTDRTHIPFVPTRPLSPNVTGRPSKETSSTVSNTTGVTPPATSVKNLTLPLPPIE